MQAAVQAPCVLPVENSAQMTAANSKGAGSEFMSLLLMLMQQKPVEENVTAVNNAQSINEPDEKEQEQEQDVSGLTEISKSTLSAAVMPEPAKTENNPANISSRKDYPETITRLLHFNVPELAKKASMNTEASVIGISAELSKEKEVKAKAPELIKQSENNTLTAEESIMQEAKDSIKVLPNTQIEGSLKTEHVIPAVDEPAALSPKQVLSKVQVNMNREAALTKAKEIDIMPDINKKDLPQENIQGQKEASESYPIRAYLKENSTVLPDKESHPMQTRIPVQELPAEFTKIITKNFSKGENAEGSKDIVIHLEPKELGKLVVKLTAQEGIISVKIVAESSETRSLLESNLTNLRQSLADQGIKYGSVEVDIGANYFQQGQQQQEWRQNRQLLGQYSLKKDDVFSEIISEEAGKNILGTRCTVDYMV